MNSISKSITSYIEKTKVYLKPGEKPSKGYQLMRGRKGGYFYNTQGRKATFSNSAVKNKT
jgi:hypothetical protein